jgi:hypothetical protein
MAQMRVKSKGCYNPGLGIVLAIMYAFNNHDEDQQDHKVMKMSRREPALRPCEDPPRNNSADWKPFLRIWFRVLLVYHSAEHRRVVP